MNKLLNEHDLTNIVIFYAVFILFFPPHMVLYQIRPQPSSASSFSNKHLALQTKLENLVPCQKPSITPLLESGRDGFQKGRITWIIFSFVHSQQSRWSCYRLPIAGPHKFVLSTTAAVLLPFSPSTSIVLFSVNRSKKLDVAHKRYNKSSTNAKQKKTFALSTFFQTVIFWRTNLIFCSKITDRRGYRYETSSKNQPKT